VLKNNEAYLTNIQNLSSVQGIIQFLEDHRKETISDSDNKKFLTQLVERFKEVQSQGEQESVAFLNSIIDNLDQFERNMVSCAPRFHVKVQLEGCEVISKI